MIFDLSCSLGSNSIGWKNFYRAELTLLGSSFQACDCSKGNPLALSVSWSGNGVGGMSCRYYSGIASRVQPNDFGAPDSSIRRNGIFVNGMGAYFYV